MRGSFRFKILALLSLLLVAMVLSDKTIAASQLGLCRDAAYRQKIHHLWKEARVEFWDWAEGKGYVSDGFRREHPYELYDIQLHTINLLRYSIYCKDKAVFDQLLVLYLKCFDTLEKTDRYLFFYYPQTSRTTLHRLKKKYLLWRNSAGYESILCSSQFLYAVSEALVAISQIPDEQRSKVEREFAKRAQSVLKNHFIRWCFDEPGPFQVRGWGCKVGGKYVRSGLNHRDFLRLKVNHKLGDDKSPSYCNAVTDTDMWIITGVANLLTAARLDSTLVSVDKIEYAKMLQYLKLGVDLLSQRATFVDLRDFKGSKVEGVVFDEGMWKDHPGHRYREYKGLVFPSKEILKHIPHPTTSSWDISHARRFIDVFEALTRDSEVLGIPFCGKKILKGLANQFVYRVFNGDFRKPLFSNFWDGSNGWYRVNYARREGYGYAPNDLSVAALTGGYAYLAPYNKDLEKLYLRLYKMVFEGTVEDQQWLRAHFSGNRFKNFKRFKLRVFGKDVDNVVRDRLLLDFLPSLCRMLSLSGSGK